MMAPPRSLWRDRRGVAAVEFAMMLPFLLLLWLGIIEFSNLHLVSRKANVAAQAAADLVAQEKSVTDAKLDDIVAAVSVLLAPYPAAGNAGWDIASVEADGDGNVSVGWRITGGTTVAGGAVPAAAAGLVTQNDSVIAVTITFAHQSTFTRFFDVINLTESAYVRPRRVSVIPLE